MGWWGRREIAFPLMGLRNCSERWQINCLRVRPEGEAASLANGWGTSRGEGKKAHGDPKAVGARARGLEAELPGRLER